MHMRTFILTGIMSMFFITPALSQRSNTDSIKAEMAKIELTNPAMKQTIEKYKKGVVKGDLESMNQLGMECMSGKNVKANLTMGLNLLDAAAKQNNISAQYNLGNYFFIFWLQKPDNDGYFSSGSKWLKKAIKGGNNDAITMLARFYFEYGKHKNEAQYVDGAIKLLEGYPGVDQVNDKDDATLNAQAWLGTINLGKWRMGQDTTALKDAKKWYRTLLKSKIEFPNYSQYIDSMQAVLSMGVPLRIDPLPTPEEEAAQQEQAGGFPGMGGGFPGMGGGFPGMGGGFPGMGGGAPQGPQGPQATFPGGNFQMQQFVRSNTFYPKELQDQKVTGNATVSFTVDVDGSVVNPKITKEADVHIMNKEALRTVMVMPDWKPAEQDGKPVQAQHTANVNFGGGGGMGGFGFGF